MIHCCFGSNDPKEILLSRLKALKKDWSSVELCYPFDEVEAAFYDGEGSARENCVDDLNILIQDIEEGKL